MTKWYGVPNLVDRDPVQSFYTPVYTQINISDRDIENPIDTPLVLYYGMDHW